MEWRGSNPDITEVPAATLREQLDGIRARVAELVPAERLEPPRRAVEELISSGAAGRALKAGDKAPNFELPDGHGRTFILAERLAQGPVIVVFYRGRWCPYCIAQLEWLERIRPEVEVLGATLAAISPQKIQHTGFTAEQHGLRYPVLSDRSNEVARQFGVAWELPGYLRAHLRGVFINLENVNADKSWELPMPATFLIVPDGKVTYAHVAPDFTRRPEPTEVFAALRRATGK